MAPNDNDLNDLFADKGALPAEESAYTHEEIFGEILESLGGSPSPGAPLADPATPRRSPIRVQLPDPEPPQSVPSAGAPSQRAVEPPPPSAQSSETAPLPRDVEPPSPAPKGPSPAVDPLRAILDAVRSERPRPATQPAARKDVDVEALLGLPRHRPTTRSLPVIPVEPVPTEPAPVESPVAEATVASSTAETLPPTLALTEPVAEVSLEDAIEALPAPPPPPETATDEIASLLFDERAEASVAVEDKAARFHAAPVAEESPAAGVLDLAALAEHAIDSPAVSAAEKSAPLVGPFGPFELLERVAVGGMAEVYRARRRGLDGFEKTLAVKRILPHLATSPEFVEMFVNEAKMVSRLTHPNIVTISELGKIEGNYYIAMEYVTGHDLRAIEERLKHQGRRVPVDLALLIVRRVCAALDYAHRARDDNGAPMEIVHSDISPQNILISSDGDVKLTDFGIAKAADRAPADAGVLRGKLYYMSPEQASGEAVDHRSDLFSLGIVLYELATGIRPFGGAAEPSILEAVRRGAPKLPHVANPRVPERLSAAIMKALEKVPEHRFQDAAEMARALERCSEGRGPDSPELARFMELLFDDLARVEPTPAPVEAPPPSSPIPPAPETNAEEIDFDAAPTAPAATSDRAQDSVPSDAAPKDVPAERIPEVTTQRDISLPSLETVEDQPSSFKRMLKKLFG